MLNEAIIPYVPIAPRVQARNPKSELLCQQLFTIIDLAVAAQMSFNHDTQTGKLSLCPGQINDLLRELKSQEEFVGKTMDKELNIEILKPALDDLIYPKFNGVFEVTSPIWNSNKVTVWQFQLNQIVRENQMNGKIDVDLLLDQVLANIRIWRASLETSTGNPQVTYDSNDLIYKLLDIEQKLDQIQQVIE
ncbi:hypothetical protein QSV37_17620 [Acinetobacter sp. VNK23]|uniref:hypothetical protein n=1 Tax=Acinetobacter thutiue TaxID=2998078 RepID=UPI002576E199|nr:hypothetical protein [Acinetobacter thutiue]MDM1022094.1 hypothetical protein [Acinetobacter thutiue]